jgi:two-component system response regulator RegA
MRPPRVLVATAPSSILDGLIDVARAAGANIRVVAVDGPYTPIGGLPTLQRAQWEHIQRALAAANGNVSQAARLLGLHRQSLQRMLRKIPPPR